MVKGFTVIREEELPFYNGKGTLVQHDKTGMKIFHFKPEKNNENYFSYILKTPVNDDTGIAHCLEHMVLQGSKKYPVKNAFFYMTQKALTNKLNASTSQYNTTYHAESYIPEDYYRLLDFYGDAVFFPLINEDAFKQEVWRFDLDENIRPFINGVVFNEMSSVEKVSYYSFKKECEKRLFQGSESGFISGGDFLEIPNLSRNDLVSFHKKYYTPANCLLFLFGKLDLDEQLSFLEEKLLKNLPEKTEETQINDSIIPLPSMTELQIKIPYKGLDESTIELSILCKDGTREDDKQRDFFFTRIEKILEKQLKFCETGHFYANKKGSPHHCYFSIGLSNVKNNEIEKARKLLVNSLEHCLDDGMDYEELKSACKKKDMRYKNPITTSSKTKLEKKITNGWIALNDPFGKIFQEEEEWESLKNKMLAYDNEKFRIMLEDYLLNNPDKVFVIKSPDKDYFTKIDAKRNELINAKLLEYGKTTESISRDKVAFQDYLKTDDSELVKKLFPLLKIKALKDIDDSGIDEIEEIQGKTGPLLLFSSAQETDGIIYGKINIAIDNLSEDEFKLLPWFSKYAGCFGFDGMKTTETRNLLKEKGLELSGFIPVYSGSDLGGKQIYENRNWLAIDFNCYEENIEGCLDIILKYLYKKNLNDIQEQKIAKDKLTKAFSEINFFKAEIFAFDYCNSFFSKRKKFSNEIMGINQLAIRKKFKSQNIDSVIDSYQKLYEKIISGSAIINVFGEERNLERAREAVKHFAKQTEFKPLLENKLKYLDEKLEDTESRTATIITPVSNGSVVIRFKGSEYPSKEFAEEKTLLNWFNRHVLYEQLRKYHGAYGCNSAIIPEDNLVTIATTRDPAPDKSLEIILGTCLEKLAKLDELEEFTENLVREIALKEYAAGLDDIRPVTKGSLSFSKRLTGFSSEYKERRMKYTLELTRKDLIEAGKRLYENSKIYKACIVTGNEDQVRGEVICDMRKL